MCQSFSPPHKQKNQNTRRQKQWTEKVWQREQSTSSPFTSTGLLHNYLSTPTLPLLSWLSAVTQHTLHFAPGSVWLGVRWQIDSGSVIPHDLLQPSGIKELNKIPLVSLELLAFVYGLKTRKQRKDQMAKEKLPCQNTRDTLPLLSSYKGELQKQRQKATADIQQPIYWHRILWQYLLKKCIASSEHTEKLLRNMYTASKKILKSNSAVTVSFPNTKHLMAAIILFQRQDCH